MWEPGAVRLERVSQRRVGARRKEGRVKEEVVSKQEKYTSECKQEGNVIHLSALQSSEQYKQLVKEKVVMKERKAVCTAVVVKCVNVMGSYMHTDG